jgi:hypothetical protein
MLLQVFFSFYIAQNLHASSLPPSKHYKTNRRGTATVGFDQREGRLLDWSKRWFGGVSMKFELSRQR